MLRSVAVIAWAIGLSQPSLPESVRVAYAETVREAAHKHHIDPFTIVSIGWHESHWRSSVPGIRSG